MGGGFTITAVMVEDLEVIPVVEVAMAADIRMAPEIIRWHLCSFWVICFILPKANGNVLMFM